MLFTTGMWAPWTQPVPVVGTGLQWGVDNPGSRLCLHPSFPGNMTLLVAGGASPWGGGRTVHPRRFDASLQACVEPLRAGEAHRGEKPQTPSGMPRGLLHVHSSTAYPAPVTQQPKCPSVDGWIKKARYMLQTHTHLCTHIYNGIVLSDKKGEPSHLE